MSRSCCSGSSAASTSSSHQAEPEVRFDSGGGVQPSSRERLEKGVKLVLLGEMNSGKTSLVYRLVRNTFQDRMEPTIGAAFMVKSMVVDGVPVKLEIWDTAGQERYRSLAPMYYRCACAAIIVYDITRKSSFETMRKWVSEVQKQGTPNLIIALAGNKADIAQHREVSTEDLDKYAAELRRESAASRPSGSDPSFDPIIAFECSAKTGQNTAELFAEVCKRLIQVYK
eukprot:TRINITY_DN1718_c0_g1_i1.p1 TRINITY_DN1718_c0_g1~~TRINITY_DN1718_c0_g1_i1.p1  ORF type:complete len:237 (-),score=48.24 TRINITY_DN1718_c0_g1_i1:142-822(-)